MRRGEIWLYEPPDSKPRPVLILTRNEAIGHLYDVIAVPTTRTARGLKTEVEIGPDDGMRVESVLLTAVCRALAAATNCD